MYPIFDSQIHTPELTNTLQELKAANVEINSTIELLTAEEFLTNILFILPAFYRRIFETFDHDCSHVQRCQSLIEAIKTQIPLPIPYLLFTDVIVNMPFDGCHRMWTCQKLFNPDMKFPVLVLRAFKDSKKINKHN